MSIAKHVSQLHQHIFTWFISNLCCHLWCNSQMPFRKQGDTSPPLSLSRRKVSWAPFFFCLSSSPAISFLSLTTQDWLIPIASTTFHVEFPFRSCSNAWSFCNAIERGIQKQLHECALLHNLQLQSVTVHWWSDENEHKSICKWILKFGRWLQTSWVYVESMTLAALTWLSSGNPIIIYIYYIHQEDYFVHILCLITSMISNFNCQRLLAEIEVASWVLSFVRHCIQPNKFVLGK